MKRIIFWVLVFGFSVAAAADTTYVSGGSTATLEKAILRASPYSVIYLRAGTYKVHDLVIRKPITLTGDKKAILDGNDKGTILIIENTQVQLHGLTFQNTGYSSVDERAAIKLLTARGCVISNNTILNACFGISVVNSTNCVIKNNTLHAEGISEQRSGNGIHAWKSDSLTIKKNTVTGHRDGIYFEFVTKTGVYENVSTDNLRYGIHFMFSNDDEYIGNTFARNGSGVAVMFSKMVHIRKNIFSDCIGGAAYGILLKEINDSEIEHNQFIRNTNGVYMEGTNRVYVKSNAFISNGWACRVQASCSSVILTDNNFIGNSFDVATNGSLAMQNFNGNYWDRYEGYDLDENGTGDIPYAPVSMYGVIVERMPYAMLLYRSFMVYLLDRSEKVMPGFTTDQVKDHTPKMKALPL